MQKKTEINVKQRESLKKKFFDERGHVRNRERFIKPLEEFYGDKIDLSFVSDAEMLVSLGVAEYLKLPFFEDLVSISKKPLPHSTKELVELVDYCLEKEKEALTFNEEGRLRPVHGEVLNEFSYGAKLCSCMESGIISMDMSLKMLKRAENYAPKKEPELT